MLIADVETLGWSALGAFIVLVGGAAVKWYLDVRKQNRTESDEDREQNRKDRIMYDTRMQARLEKLEDAAEKAQEETKKCLQERAADHAKIEMIEKLGKEDREESRRMIEELARKLQEFTQSLPHRPRKG